MDSVQNERGFHRPHWNPSLAGQGLARETNLCSFHFPYFPIPLAFLHFQEHNRSPFRLLSVYLSTFTTLHYFPCKLSLLGILSNQLFFSATLFTPHAQRERGKVIGRGVHIIGERAKRARHSLVCSIENRGYI